jgi:MFS family permease
MTTQRWKLFPQLLSLHNFRLLWLGESVSSLGDQFYLVALPWLALQLTGSGLALGTVLMTAMVPRAVFMLGGGALTDRWSSRTMMICSNVGRAVLVACLSVLVIRHATQMWQVYAISVGFGTFDALFYPAYTSLLPSIVSPEQLAAGNSVLQSTLQLSGLIGPALAGIVIARTGVGPALVVDAVSFAFSVMMLSLITVAKATSSIAGVGNSAPASLLSSIAAGIRYSLREPIVRALLLPLAAINLCFSGPFLVGISWIAKHRFQGADALGNLFSAFAAGSLVGSLSAGPMHKVKRLGPLIVGLAVALALGLAAMGLQLNLWASAAVLFALGMVVGFVSILVVTMLQGRAAPEFLGRVMSLVMLGSVGLAPLSYVIAGALVDYGVARMFVEAAITMFAMTMLISANRVLWRRMQ